MQPQATNPLLAQLTHIPFPDLAEALRAACEQITRDWVDAVRDAMPQMRRLTFFELKNSTPQIIMAIADALESDDPERIAALHHRAPGQGLSRLELNFDVIEVMQEDRLLRAIIVRHVEALLGRGMDELEAAALHVTIDVMLQESVIALVNKQKAQVRSAAVSELKFLSYLSHDLSNNLAASTMWLEALQAELKKTGGFSEAQDFAKSTRKSIDNTVKGMKRMLDHERLHQSGTSPQLSAVDVSALAKLVALQFAGEVAVKNLYISIDIPRGTTIESDGDLLCIILQNLIGNAVKYSTHGVIRVGIDDVEITDAVDIGRAIWVADEGPGIALEQMGYIFNAFQRGDTHGREGVGLGLAIAARASRLLDADLTVHSVLGIGSTFRLTLPDRRSAATAISAKPEPEWA